MAKFSTLLSTSNGFKAAAPASKLTFKLVSASLLIDHEDLLAETMTNAGILNDGNPAKDFDEAQQLLIEAFLMVSKMEDEQMLLEPEARDQSYTEWKQTLEEVRNEAGITVVLRGDFIPEGEEKPKRVTVYVNPERTFADGNTRKAGRFNTRVLFETGTEVTAFGTQKLDAKRGLVINAFGVGPHREENDPINQAREARRAALVTA